VCSIEDGYTLAWLGTTKGRGKTAAMLRQYLSEIGMKRREAKELVDLCAENPGRFNHVRTSQRWMFDQVPRDIGRAFIKAGAVSTTAYGIDGHIHQLRKKVQREHVLPLARIMYRAYNRFVKDPKSLEKQLLQAIKEYDNAVLIPTFGRRGEYRDCALCWLENSAGRLIHMYGPNGKRSTLAEPINFRQISSESKRGPNKATRMGRVLKSEGIATYGGLIKRVMSEGVRDVMVEGVGDESKDAVYSHFNSRGILVFGVEYTASELKARYADNFPTGLRVGLKNLKK
jgi:hypothetical protein